MREAHLTAVSSSGFRRYRAGGCALRPVLRKRAMPLVSVALASVPSGSSMAPCCFPFSSPAYGAGRGAFEFTSREAFSATRRTVPPRRLAGRGAG